VEILDLLTVTNYIRDSVCNPSDLFYTNSCGQRWLDEACCRRSEARGTVVMLHFLYMGVNQTSRKYFQKCTAITVAKHYAVLQTKY